MLHQPINNLILPVKRQTNIQPDSILPLLCKVFVKIMHEKLYSYIETFLNQSLCGFIKSHSTKHALFRLLLKCQKEVYSWRYGAKVFMDLSKSYDWLPHIPLIAKF